MDYINILIDQYNIPVLTAFLIGILTSISPCPLATNITAVAFISKEVKGPKQTLMNGLSYTLGRGISYTVLAILMYFGWSSVGIDRVFLGWGDKVLGPVLIVIGLVMLDVVKLNIKTNNQKVEQVKLWLSSKGYLGALLLGMLFALAFCPYSGVLFFGVLTPLVINSTEGVLLAPVFALGTGIPVIIFSFVIAFGMQKMGQMFATVGRVEKVVRRVVALTFVLVGVFYLQYPIKYLLENFL